MDSVDFLVWDKSFSVGNDLLDEHHKKLFLLISSFNTAALNGQKHELVLTLLDNLKKYTIMHFQAEEAYMASIKYSGLEEHKNSHKELIERLVQFELKLNGAEELNPIDISKFLKEWIVLHVLNEDMNYVS